MESRIDGGSAPVSRAASRHRRPSKGLRRALVLAIVCLALALGAGTAWAYNYNKLDLTWYTDHRDASEFTVSTAGEMQAFSALVNGEAVGSSGKPLAAVSFEGKTVKLGGGVNLVFSGEFTPIGTAEHPFEGVFDGQGNAIGGLSITKPSRTSDIGLFGVTGAGSQLKNVDIDDSGKVNLTSSDGYFENVGSLVGSCGGSIENCQSRARVTLNHRAVDVSGEVMKNVGGVAGSVQGTVSATSFGGALRAETPANAYTDDLGSSKATVVENVGGIAGYFGGDLSQCANAGQLLVITSGKSGIDRFGSTVDAKSLFVGGVGGYVMGNVEGCSNTANLFTTSAPGATMGDMDNENARQADGGADAMGGVVGSLRGISMSGLGDNRGDPGLEPGAPKLTLSNCSNTGYVSGLHAVGGIVGSQGSNTDITRCTNGKAGLDATSNVGHVRTTRWNKPSGGGIAGQSWGVISYSRNHGQSENTKTGYFTAGICGMLERHEQQAGTPEIYSCYSTGNVYCGGATASFREGGIVGENDHFCNVHDNVFMYGTVSTHIKDHVDADDVAAGQNFGTVANTTVVYETPRQAAEKKGLYIGSGEVVAILNKLAANSDWESYYFVTKTANKGFPVLNGQAQQDGKIDLGSIACSVSYQADASYTAAYNPTPKLKVSVTVDGLQKELVQGSDYKVVADPAALNDQGVCKGITNGERPYKAGIEGIGNYYGTPGQKTAYGIVKGKFSECTVSVVESKWTGKPQNNPTVSVSDAGGSIVNPDEYTYVVNDGEDCIKCFDYPVVVTAKASSNYEGTATGSYAIGTVDIYKDTDVIGFTYGSQVWYYDEDKNNIYEAIPADAQGQPLPDGSPLQYDNEGLPRVMPQTYRDTQTGQTLTRTSYVNADGRTLSVAEPKRKAADGKPVYGDMAVDYTGSPIRPSIIGVRLNGRLLYGVTEEELQHAPDPLKIDYAVLYGMAGDGTALTDPRNVNATTSETRPEASVVVRGNTNGAFSNYVYMGFRIKPVAASDQNIIAVQKTSTLDYVGGGRPSVPATVYKEGVGNVNPAVEVRYAPDPASYKADDPSTYTVLDGANWKLEFDHATTSEGAPLTETTSGYVDGSLMYFKVVPTDRCSVTGWSGKAVEDAWTVIEKSSSKVQLNDPAIKVTWTSKPYDPANFYPDLSVVNTATGQELKLGVDYKIATVPSKYAKPPVLNPKTGLLEGLMRIIGMGSYTGIVDISYTSERGTLSDAMLDPQGGVFYSWTFVDPGKPSKSHSRKTELAWRQDGWDATELSKVLNLIWKNGRYMYANEATFTVEAIEKEGVPVDKIDQMDTPYVLKTVFNSAKSKWFSRAQTPEQDITVKMMPQAPAAGYDLTVISKAEISPSEYRYTGEPITPQLKMYDGAGDLVNPAYFSFVYPEGGRGVPLDTGDYNVPSKEPGRTGRYDDLRVTGDGVHYVQDKRTDPTPGSQVLYAASDAVNLSFKVVPADIADATSVRVQVDEAFYAPNAPAEPNLSFFDATTGAKLNYVKGTDYTLSYRNNDKPGSSTSDEPPTAIITPTANGHLVVNGSATDSMEAPFTIKGDGIDVGEATWDFAPEIVVHGDGSLSQPGAVGIAGEAHLALGAYRVEVGTYTDGRFSVQNDGWQAGDKAYLRVTGTEFGVLSGSKVLGSVQVVAQSEANTFAQGSPSLKAQAATISYTGKVALPQVSATDASKPLVEGRDFKVESASVNAGEAAATVSGLGAYAGSMQAGFSIKPTSMEGLAVTAKKKTYTGQQIDLEAEDVDGVTLNGVALPDSDWALKPGGFGPNVNVADGGTATLVPGTSGNLAGSKEFGFDIGPAPLVNDELQIVSSNATYTGLPVELSADTVQVRDTKRNRDLAFGTDFVVAGYENNLNVGTATVYLSGAGNYSATANSVTKTFNIKPADFAQATVQGLDDSYDWCGTGTPVQPVPRVVLQGVTLPSSDYTLSYGTNDAIGPDAGTLTVTPQGKNVTGQAKAASFGIAVDLTRATIEAVPNGSYEPGSAYEPELKVSFNGIVLSQGAHYAVAYDTSTAGQKTLTVSGIQPCTGEKKVRYNIEGKALSQDMLSLDTQNLTFTGDPVEPPVSLKDGSTDLVEGVDFQASYENNVNATGLGSPALVTVTGMGNYAGMLTATFPIAPKGLDSGNIAATATAAGLFSGSPVDATVQASDVRAKGGSYQLVLGIDFTLKCSGNTSVGSQSATATLTGMGNYAGTRALSYDVQGDMAAVQIQPVADQAYTGTEVKPAPAATLAGVALVEGTDFTVSYSDNRLPGTATMTLEGTGLYVGTASATFAISMPSYTDPATGVMVSGTALVDLAAKGSEVRVEVKPLSVADALYAQLRDHYAADAFVGFALELHTVKGGVDTLVTEGFGQLSIALPVGAAFDGRTATVVMRHMGADGAPTFETKRVTIDQGRAVVTVDKLSEFFVAVDKTPAAGGGGAPAQEQPPAGTGAKLAPTGQGAKLAPTGDGLGLAVWACGGCALAALMLALPACFRKRKG